MRMQWFHRIRSVLGSDHAEEEGREALRSAYARFERSRPGWAASLFDWHFLAHNTAPILNGISQDSNERLGARLVEAWVDQLRGFRGEPRQRIVSEAVPVARCFVKLLRSELARRTAVDEPIEKSTTSAATPASVRG